MVTVLTTEYRLSICLLWKMLPLRSDGVETVSGA